jgi:hypothetical protein
MITQRTITYELTLTCEITASVDDDGVVDIESVVAVHHSPGGSVRACLPPDVLSAVEEECIANHVLDDLEDERLDHEEQREIDREDMGERYA